MLDQPQARRRAISIADAGSDIVLHDGESNRYHTLNPTAARIWRACDGIRTPDLIAKQLHLPVDVVEVAISELQERDLLASTTPQRQIDRRAVIKRLTAAGLAGAIVMPVIGSISGIESTLAGGSCVAILQPCTLTSQCCGPEVICFDNRCVPT